MKTSALELLPAYSFSGEGLPETPPMLVKNLKIYYSSEKNWSLSNQYFCHENYVLRLLISGKRTISVGEVEVRMSPGDAVIIPPFTRHAVTDRNVEPFEELKASFRLSPDESRLKEISGLRFRMKKELQKKFFEAAGNFQSWSTGNAAAGEICVCNFAILLRLIVSGIFEEMPRELHSPRDDRRLARIVEYLAANRNHNVTLKELSQVMNLSGSTIRQLFKRKMNTSLGRYELTRRLKSGVEMLRSSDMTANEIAPLVGFDSASSFLRALHREIGMTSRQLRNRDTAEISKNRSQ